MFVLNFARGETRVCSSRDEAVRLFFSCSSFNDYFECNKGVLMRLNGVLFVLDDIKLPHDVSLRLENVVLTESIHDVRQAIKEFVSDRVSADLVRVEYLDNEYLNSF